MQTLCGRTTAGRPRLTARNCALIGLVAVTLGGCSAGRAPHAAAPETRPAAATKPVAAVPATPSLAPALALQNQFVQVVRKIGPSVVLVETPAGLGSGIIYDNRGDIVTNAHVVGSYRTFRVTLADGKQYSGSLVGTFPLDDVGVLHIDATGLHPAQFANSGGLRVGDIVIAVGNPLGLQSSVTQGIVSALGRTVSEPGGVALPDVIQTSAPINPGNSGGALVDLAGDVVGIPTLAAIDPELGGSAPGIGFAIPSNVVRDIAGQLIRYGHVVNSHRAYLGIEAANVTVAGRPAVLIYAVSPGGPAARGGLRPDEIITAIQGKPTATADALAEVLAGLRPGQRVKVGLLRPDGVQASAEVTLGQYPG